MAKRALTSYNNAKSMMGWKLKDIDIMRKWYFEIIIKGEINAWSWSLVARLFVAGRCLA